METLNIKPQTVVLLVGPTGCGKTVFSQEILLEKLRIGMNGMNKTPNIQYLSSDQFREDLIGNPNHEENDVRLDFVSEQAFTLLRATLTAVISYPVNADFVVVDTTGMSETFRREIMDITYKGNYNFQLIVFDYKNRDDYYKYIPQGDQARLKEVSNSIKRFKDRMSELTKKEYPNQFRVKSIDFSDTRVVIENLALYAKYFLPRTEDYVIIGDVHGCFDELKELLCASGFEFDQNNLVTKVGRSFNGSDLKIVFVGDIIDKGAQIKECVDFVYYLVENHFAYFVKGNHENFVYNYMNGVKPYTELAPEFIATFLNSVAIFDQDVELKAKFYNLFENGMDFYISDRFIVTHAPCKTEFLGKVRTACLKNQRNFRFPRRAEFQTEEEFVTNTEKELAFMKDESRYNNPYHVVGHVILPNVAQFNNKLMIDTGCVSGGKLTSVEIGYRGTPKFRSVKSKRSLHGDIFPIFESAKKFDFDELDHKDQTRIKYLCLDKVNFISGTMAPADKDKENNILESLDQAIVYYKNAGVGKIILQPKYMGSRGNVYLFKDVEQSYVVTRNGYRVKPAAMEQLKPVIAAMTDRIFTAVFPNKNVKMILLDAEILPWNLIGSGLIDQHFKPVSIAVKSETEQLIAHGFETVIDTFKQKDDYRQYLEDRKSMNKDELTGKFGHTKERTLRNLYDYKHLSLNDEMEYSSNYESQLDIHGNKNAPVEIQPFAILKVVFDDDTEFVFDNESNITMYPLISTRPYAVLDFQHNDEEREKHPELLKNEYIVSVYGDYSGKLGGNTATNFFDYLTTQLNMEGIVIKPEKVYTKGIAPYIKVRNENYLTIVYGHNYKFSQKFNKLIAKKGIKRKLQTSIKEYELGMKMLKTPYNKIMPENDDYKQLLAQMIIEVEKEKQLDPRL